MRRMTVASLKLTWQQWKNMNKVIKRLSDLHFICYIFSIYLIIYLSEHMQFGGLYHVLYGFMPHLENVYSSWRQFVFFWRSSLRYKGIFPLSPLSLDSRNLRVQCLLLWFSSALFCFSCSLLSSFLLYSLFIYFSDFHGFTVVMSFVEDFSHQF